MPLDTSDQIAVAIQVLMKRHRLDLEALGAVLSEHHGESVVRRAMQRGVGMVCDADVCASWALVEEGRREAMRGLLRDEEMADLIDVERRA